MKFRDLLNMNEPWKHAKWNKPDTTWQILYDSTCTRYLETGTFVETENRSYQGLEGEKMGSYCSMGTEFTEFLFEMIKSLEMDSGGGCTTLWMLLMPMKCTLKVAKMVNFTLCIFSHSFEKSNGRKFP